MLQMMNIIYNFTTHNQTTQFKLLWHWFLIDSDKIKSYDQTCTIQKCYDTCNYKNCYAKQCTNLSTLKICRCKYYIYVIILRIKILLSSQRNFTTLILW